VSRALAFTFKAVRRDGSLESGVVEATTREAAVAVLGSRGAFAIELVAPASHTARAGVNADDLALGLRALVTVLDSGVPLGKALAILDGLVPHAWLAALPDLRRRIEQGERLAAALEASPLPFPPEVIGIISAGEAGSGLVAATESAAQLLEQRAATRAALRNALAYPSMLLVAGSASVALLVGIVLPRFAGLLTEYGQTLPLLTRIVLMAGVAAKAAFFPVLLFAAAAAVLLPQWLAQPDRLRRLHRMLLRIPGVGAIRFAAATANTCSALAALLGSGVPLGTALTHAARASGDREIAARLLRARQRIASGERVHAALESERATTPTAARLVHIGEETGRLAELLAHAARIESTQGLQRLQRLTRRLEPLLILAFGAVVMVVAAALLQAMYGLRPVTS
jgi:general secretion pathway protein F